MHKGKTQSSQRKGLVDAFVFKNSLPQSAQREKHKGSQRKSLVDVVETLVFVVKRKSYHKAHKEKNHKVHKENDGK